MKANKFSSTIITISLVIFLGASGISNPVVKSTGDNLKKSENKVTPALTSNTGLPVSQVEDDNEFGYLRFDVNEFTSESAVVELPVNSFDYLRFDVNNYLEANTPEMMEMPVSNEFGYLRFEVSNFIESNSCEINEMPAEDFKYLRFDVNNFIASDNLVPEELPVTE